MKKFAPLFFFNILILLLVVVAVFAWQRTFPDSLKVRTSKTTVIKEIRALNRLETASFTIEKVIDAGTSGGRLKQLLFGDRILLIAHGEVIAGFDFSQMSDDAIIVDKTTLRMSLPPPQIFFARLDNKETRVYDRRRGFLTQGNTDLESEARSVAEESIRTAACQGNILDQASSNARTQLTTLFKAFGFTTVIFDIPQGSC
ncbi:MAG: DUF4230 domain-containing protein [Candidatus Levybacteria bacterium]|nr:DUF4230 domain-containing protein [Candidatus Levybacteria bacterium]